MMCDASLIDFWNSQNRRFGAAMSTYLRGRTRRVNALAQRVERGSYLGHLSADQALGSQPAGERSPSDTPHAVPTGDVHARRPARTNQRQPIGGAGPRTDPLVNPVLPVQPGQPRLARCDHRLDAPRVERVVGATELHRSTHAEAVTQWCAGQPRVREVHRPRRKVLGRHAEAVPAPGLDGLANTELAGEFAEPRSGRQNNGISAQLAGRGVDDDTSTGGLRAKVADSRDRKSVV